MLRCLAVKIYMDWIEIQKMGFDITIEDENGEETTIQFVP